MQMSSNGSLLTAVGFDVNDLFLLDSARRSHFDYRFIMRHASLQFYGSLIPDAVSNDGEGRALLSFQLLNRACVPAASQVVRADRNRKPSGTFSCSSGVWTFGLRPALA